MDINFQTKNSITVCTQRYKANCTPFKSPGPRYSYLQRIGCGGRRALPDNLKEVHLASF